MGAPLFYVSGISFDSQNRPIEVFKSVTRADKIRFSSILTTQPKEGWNSYETGSSWQQLH